MKASDYDPKKEFIGVDLDGTLAFWDKWVDGAPIGEPVPAMLERVKQWIKEGKTVKIFTARIADIRVAAHEQKANIEAWCMQHIGQALPITCVKDCYMKEIWDDKAVGVRANTGTPDAIAYAADQTEVLTRRLAEAQERITHLEGTIDKLSR